MITNAGQVLDVATDPENDRYETLGNVKPTRETMYPFADAENTDCYWVHIFTAANAGISITWVRRAVEACKSTDAYCK